MAPQGLLAGGIWLSAHPVRTLACSSDPPRNKVPSNRSRAEIHTLPYYHPNWKEEFQAASLNSRGSPPLWSSMAGCHPWQLSTSGLLQCYSSR
jgi:hypothetical protein